MRLIHDGERKRARAGPAAVAGRRSAAILAAWALGFLVLAAGVVRSRGPVEWRAPTTVVSNSHAGQRGAVPFLLFLWEVRSHLPPGATIAVVGPNLQNDSGPLEDLITIGQLPRNDVVPARMALEKTIPPPRFLAVFGGTHTDDRYRLVAVLEAGRLYERAP